MNQIPLTKEHLEQFRGTNPAVSYCNSGMIHFGITNALSFHNGVLEVFFKFLITQGGLVENRRVDFNNPMVTLDGDGLELTSVEGKISITNGLMVKFNTLKLHSEVVRKRTKHH